MSRIAIVVSTVGYHWEELFAAFDVFARSGASIDIFTVNGGPPRADPKSLHVSAVGGLLGFGVSPSIAPDSPRGQLLRKRLLEVVPLASFEASRYDALYLPGGHGCLFDVNRSELLHACIADLHERGALLSAVCHATSTFSFVRVGGRPIVSGHALTGFPAPLDTLIIRVGLVHSEYVPLPFVNDDALRDAGAKLSVLDVAEAIVNPRTMRVSLPFVTGVGPKSAAPVAEVVLKSLEARRAPSAAPSIASSQA